MEIIMDLDDTQETEGQSFDLEKLQQQVVSKSEYNEQIAQRDKKINDMREAHIRAEEVQKAQIEQLTNRFDSLSNQFGEKQKAQKLDSYRLTDEERDMLGDNLPAFQKVVGGALSAEQQKIADLTRKIEKLQSGTPSIESFQQKTSESSDQMAAMLDALSKKTIGLDRLLADENFISDAKSTPYSRFGKHTLYDQVNYLNSIKFGQPAYEAAQKELQDIVTAVREAGKPTPDATIQTNGGQEVQPTPQQEKLLAKGQMLRQKLRTHLNNGDTKSAVEAKKELESLAVEAKQFI